MHNYLDFEKTIAALDGKICELQKLSQEDDNIEMREEIEYLSKRSHEALEEIYKKLTPWQKTLVARHPDRPHCLDYVQGIFTELNELAGDRKYSNDDAILTFFARFEGQPVAIIGHEKGSDTQSRIRHNFGSARPEGYRKAIRIMKLAERFNLPVITFIDTAGAYPGVSAEERGQAEAIAQSTATCLNLTVPIISIVIGEGGSGGAVAIATANQVYMLEHATYSVISPEGAASILWRDSSYAQRAATNMKITAQDLLSFNVIDGIIPEPFGGAHRNKSDTIKNVHHVLKEAFTTLFAINGKNVKEQRKQKYFSIGKKFS